MRLLRISAIFILLGICFYNPLSAQGSVYRTGDIIHISENDTISNQIVGAGDWIEIAGTLENDLYLAGRQIMMTGSVGDDAFLMGESISVTGSVEDMLIVLGSTVLIDGNINGDLVAISRSIQITENANISGNVLIAADQIRLHEAIIGGQVRLAGREVNLNNRTENSVTIYSSNITFGDQYSAAGTTKIISNTEIYRDNLGIIPANLEIELKRRSFFSMLLLQTGFYLSFLFTGLVLLLLFRPVAMEIQEFSMKRFWKNTGIGLLSVLLVPLVLTLLLIPVVTIPLAIILCMIFTIILFVSYLLVSMMLGFQLLMWFKDKPQPATYYWALGIGLIVLAIINNLPFLGFLFSLLLLFFGVGSFIAYFHSRYKEKNRSIG
jgi:hypothetical protein